MSVRLKRSLHSGVTRTTFKVGWNRRRHKPDVLDDGRFARWSFAPKAALFVGLYDVGEVDAGNLLGFNKLRNRVAHGFLENPQQVFEFLNWHSRKDSGVPDLEDPLAQVKMSFILLLASHPGVLARVCSL